MYNFVTCGSRVNHSSLQTWLAHLYLYTSDVVRSVMTSSIDQRCFDCFCDRFANQEMLLAITFDGKNILMRAMKQFGLVASNKSR